MKTNPSMIAHNIQPVLSEFSEVAAAYLFGSAATGKMTAESDIDIAILLDESSPRSKHSTLLKSLFSPLCRALRADVHLLFLNDASYLTRAQVLSKGKLLYTKDHKQLALFRMKSLLLYAEFAPYLEMTRRGLQNKIRRNHGR